MNIYNILHSLYYKGLIMSQKYSDYSKEKKQERLMKINNYLEKNYLKDCSEEKKGNIITLIHIIGIILLIILYIFIPINKYTISLIIGLAILQVVTNRYFGPNGCILTRLERLYYDDKKWFGPLTFLILFLNIEPTRFNIDISIGIGGGIIFAYYLYRLSRYSKSFIQK